MIDNPDPVHLVTGRKKKAWGHSLGLKTEHKSSSTQFLGLKDSVEIKFKVICARASHQALAAMRLEQPHYSQ